jgi:hypothetical protein
MDSGGCHLQGNENSENIIDDGGNLLEALPKPMAEAFDLDQHFLVLDELVAYSRFRGNWSQVLLKQMSSLSRS